MVWRWTRLYPMDSSCLTRCPPTVSGPLTDPQEDAAAWERLRHRERVTRRARRDRVLRLAWFVIPAFVVILWGAWFVSQLHAGPHSATVCWRFDCQDFSSSEFAAYLASVSVLYFLLAGTLTAVGVGLFFGKHPPFPVRFRD